MSTITTLSGQGGRRYPQMNGLAAVLLARSHSVGHAPAPAVVAGDDAGLAIDLPELGLMAPGSLILGDGGGGGLT